MEPAGVSAIFSDARAAKEAARALRDAGFRDADIHLGQPQSDAAAARVEVRAEAETLTVTDPKGEGIVMTNLTMWRGAIVGGIVGIALGSMIFGVAELLLDQPPGGTITFLAAALVSGFAAAGVAGALIGAYWSFKMRELNVEETMREDFVLQVAAGSDAQIGRASEILVARGARHLEEARPKNFRSGERWAG